MLADHVSEPSLPIKQIVALNIYDYPNAVTKINNCDGSETRTWNAARIEPQVSFELQQPDGSPANDDPSEHFAVRLDVFRGFPGRQTIWRKDWDALWVHQNRGPHANNPQSMEITQSNSYFLQEHLGLWRVDVQVIGQESGRILNASCQFRIAAP